jgi:cytochrome P450
MLPQTALSGKYAASGWKTRRHRATRANMNTEMNMGWGLNSLVHALYARAEARRQIGGSPPGGDLLGDVPLVDDPVDIDDLAKRPGQFIKNYSLVSALGYSRFNTDGEEWAIRRNITQGIFQAAGKPSRKQPVSDCYRAALEQSEPTFEAIQGALFRASLTIFYDAFGLVPDVAPTVVILDRVREVLRRLQYYSWVAPSDAERKKTFSEAKAVVNDFAKLLAADDKAASEMERFSRGAAELERFSAAEEFVMNLFAGVETTVATTSWVVDRISVNPKVQARIHDEIRGGGPTPYTECMINETMRFFPPIPFVVRQVAADTTVGMRDFKNGQLVLMSVIGAHHHPDYWADSGVYDSSRSEFMQDSYDRRAFIPFLTGPRMCGGARLGRLEIREAVRTLVKLFEMKRADNAVQIDYGLALRPVASPSLSIVRRDH